MKRPGGATLAALLTIVAATAHGVSAGEVPHEHATTSGATHRGDASAADAIVEVHFAMGTPVAITGRGDDASRTRDAIRAAFGEIRRLEAILSAWDPDSATSRLNREAGRAPSPVPPELGELLASARRLSRATDGAFSVLVGPIVDLWRAADPRDPSPAALAQATALARPDGLLCDGGRAALRRPGMRLDLDGIAKGFAADRVLALLRARGVRAAIVNLGGSSMAAFGDAGDGARGWPVEIPLPEAATPTARNGASASGPGMDGRVAGAARDVRTDHPQPTTADRPPAPDDAHVLRLVDEALSASASGAGDATGDGAPVRRRVIVDPASGARVARDATAVVVHVSATDAEAWSKALLVRGWPVAALLARYGGRVILQDGPDAPRCSAGFRNAPAVCKVLRPAAVSSTPPRPRQEKPAG